MRDAALTGLAGGLLLAVAVFLIAEYAVPAVFPITSETLEAAPTDLGELRVDEQREFTVTLRNKSFRAVALAPPETNCGCLSLERKPIVVKGRGCAEVPFSLRAPSIPGTLLRRITFRLAGDSALAWEVPVRAGIAATIWAVPSTLDFMFDDPDDLLKSLAACHHVPDVEIGRFVADSPAVQILPKRTEEDRCEFEVVVNLAKSAGKRGAMIRVHESKTDAVLLEIPVRWMRRPVLTCSPSVLVLDDLDVSKERSEKQILLLSRVDASPSSLTSVPLFPWIHVEGVQRKPFGFVIRLSFDTRAVPDTIDEPIIRFQLRESDSAIFMAAQRGERNRF